MTEGWQETAAARATGYITEQTWRGLFASRSRGSCRTLATLAKHILAGKQQIHDLVGMFAAWLFSLINRRRFAQDLVRELTTRMPLPWDVKLVAVARGVQITGILICLSSGRELDKCQCFVDLALAETKERVKKILSAATDDWIKLADFPPAAGTSGERAASA